MDHFSLSTDTALIMEKIFLLKIQDEAVLRDLMLWYDRSNASVYVRDEIMKDYRRRIASGSFGITKSRIDIDHLTKILYNRPNEVPILTPT